MVSNTVHLHQVPDAVFHAELGNLMQIHGKNPVIIPQRLIQNENFRTGTTFPAIKIGSIQSSAMVEVFDSAGVEDLRNAGAVAECVGMEIQLNVLKRNVKFFV